MADTKDTSTLHDWLRFLAQQGATITDGLISSFDESPGNYPSLGAALTDLSDLGVLALEGADTKRFLQGQSTSDSEQLNASSVLPGAICNAKGRMLTSYHAVEPLADTVLMVMQRPLVDTTIDSLGKYAAFFKTTLSNASEDYRLLGISGPDCESALDPLFDAIPKEINQLCSSGDYWLLRISAQQFLVLVSVAAAEALWLKLAASLTPSGPGYWQLQSIRAGLAQVQAQSLEQFVPQMLNLQATGAVNFKKGCYTGQEIVARMQYLGKLKRRTYRVIIDAGKLPQAGAEIYASADNKLVGSVLMAAPADEKSAEMLALLHETQAEAASLIIDGETRAVQIAELPYSLTL
ncbi:MAG: folate-binding protein YgfZ [Gammaproteobacteria bacterium]|nr:folate-binding protein YgfZ [Gammaproteobacteria bacterium]MBQ0838142.1 folate-binding protein YgfZ [Gammaproteobacteria bacterium]